MSGQIRILREPHEDTIDIPVWSECFGPDGKSIMLRVYVRLEQGFYTDSNRSLTSESNKDNLCLLRCFSGEEEGKPVKSTEVS